MVDHSTDGAGIQKDRYKPTVYQKEMSSINPDNSSDNTWTQIGHNPDTQASIGKDSADKESIDKLSLGVSSLAKPSAALAENIKHRDDISRVYNNGFKLDLCDFVIDVLTEQCFAGREIHGHTPDEFREYVENRFDAQTLAELVNKLLTGKQIAEKRSYILAVIADEYLNEE